MRLYETLLTTSPYRTPPVHSYVDILVAAEPMHTTILQPSEGTPAQLPSQESAAQAQAADQPQQAQHAQQMQQSQMGGQQGGAVGGVLRKPKLVGIGHMCRAINDLTGGATSTHAAMCSHRLPRCVMLCCCCSCSGCTLVL